MIFTVLDFLWKEVLTTKTQSLKMLGESVDILYDSTAI